MAVSMKSLNLNNLTSKGNLTNLALLVVLALSVNYVNIKNYEALICLLVVAVGVNLVTNKLLLSLVIAIVVTNLLVSMNHLKVREGLASSDKKNTKKNTKKNKN